VDPIDFWLGPHTPVKIAAGGDIQANSPTLAPDLHMGLDNDQKNSPIFALDLHMGLDNDKKKNPRDYPHSDPFTAISKI